MNRMDKSTDLVIEPGQKIAIVGAGIVGLALALKLQAEGLPVLLLDRVGPGSGCSKGNAGHFATEQVFPLASMHMLKQLPAMLLDPIGPLRLRAGYLLQALPWLLQFCANVRPSRQRALRKALSALNEPSLHSWQALVKLAGAEDLLCWQGALLVSEEPSLAALKQTFVQYQQAGIAVRWLNQAQVLAMESALSHQVTGAIEFPQVAHTVDPFALCQRLYQRFLALGGEFKQADVQTVLQRNNGFELKGTDSQSAPFLIQSPKLVIAAGAHSHQLCQQLGWKVPLEAERGYHLMACPRPLSRPVSSLERKFIMTPMQHGLRLAGTVEFAGLASAPDYRRADALLTHANALLCEPTMVTQEPRWFGHRPSLPDSLPVLGACPKHQGLFFNFGHQHLGLTQAAFSAELLCAEILGQQPAVDLTPYQVSRF